MWSQLCNLLLKGTVTCECPSQRAGALARSERGGGVGVHEDDQADLSPRHRSGTLAFGAAKGFEFGFERRPISAVLGLFGVDLGIEGFVQGLAGA